MPLDAWISTAVVVAVFVTIGVASIPPYLVILGGVALLIISGVIEPTLALSGFANEGVVTIAALFIVAAGLSETGAVAALAQRLLGKPQSPVAAQARLVTPVTAGSAFLNNTPIVTMLMPVVSDWARKVHAAPSQLLMPLSFAAILGGLITLIGTSTNLVVHGLFIETNGQGFGFFDITSVGLPCALIGLAYILLFGRKLLPRHEDVLHTVEDPREFTIEMVVDERGPLVGKSISEAGLRHLPGCYLMEIHRRGFLLPNVGPEEVLDADDQLVFVGVVDSMVDLQKIPGLRPATTQVFKLETPRHERWFVEAVISHTCPLIGQTIRESRFRNRYSAVIIAVARNGQRIQKRLGDIILQTGDVLLLEALPAFVEQQRNSRDFYLISRITNASPPRHERRWLATGIVSAMVLTAAVGLVSMLQAAIAAAGLMLITGCCSEEAARRRIDWQLLLAIAASFGLGHGIAATGAARTIAETLLSYSAGSPHIALIMVYTVTVVLSGLITNNATAVVMYPIVISTANQLGTSQMPFLIAMMIAASASFATPLGYQTNLMVWGPGGYKLRDFVRFGLPLSIIIGIVTVIITPLAWPF